MPHSTDDLAEAEVAFQRALLHADADALDVLLDDEATLTGTGGVGEPRDEVVEAFRTGRRRVLRFEVERTRARVLEELGLTFVIATVAGAEAGVAFEARERHTRTWRLGDEWVLVASHASLVKDQRSG